MAEASPYLPYLINGVTIMVICVSAVVLLMGVVAYLTHRHNKNREFVNDQHEMVESNMDRFT